MSVPTFNAYGNYHVLRWEKERITIEVDRIREVRDGHLSGEIKITTDANGYNPLLHRSVSTLSSQAIRNQLARSLNTQYANLVGDWTVLLEQLYWLSADHYRLGDPILLAGNGTQPIEIPYLLYPLLQQNQPTLLYGEGGTGKSYLAAFIALSVQTPYESYQWHPLQSNVLYLDWETDFDIFAARIKKLKAGIGLPDNISIRYRRCWMSLADDAETIKRMIVENDIGLVVVDSCGGACGGDPNFPEPVNRFFATLRYLNTTSLLIHHVPKHISTGNSKDKSPYGSAYFYNWSRIVFMLRKAQDDDYELNLGIFHKKANEGPTTADRGFLLRFLDESVTITHKDTAEVPDFLDSLKLPAKIEHMLKTMGKISIEAVVDEFGCTKDHARITLNRMVDKERIVMIGTDYGLVRKGLI